MEPTVQVTSPFNTFSIMYTVYSLHCCIVVKLFCEDQMRTKKAITSHPGRFAEEHAIPDR